MAKKESVLVIHVAWSDEDEAYLASVYGTSMCAHGATKGQALAELCSVLSFAPDEIFWEK